MNSLDQKFCWQRSDGVPDVNSATVLIWNGFEPRSTAFARKKRLSDAKKVIVMRFIESQFDLTENDEILSHSANTLPLTRLELDRSSQFDVYKSIRNEIEKIEKESRIIFDITCFPRDILLIVLYICWSLGRLDSLCCVYNLAADYSIQQTNISEKWLSKGVASVSPVIGYRGIVRPDRALQLVGLVGFDDQRVMQIADILSPHSFVFAHGKSELKHREWLVSQGKDAVELLMNQFNDSREDSFICEDGDSVNRVLDRARSENPNYNLVVVPMNNKISTLFVGTYCLKNRDVQICYGGALIYNHSDYSSESSTFYYWNSSTQN